MSSSDEDWMISSKPPALSGAGTTGGTDMDMMAARRQALRMQREAQQQRQQLKQPSHGRTLSSASSGGGLGGGDRSGRRAPTAGRLGTASSREEEPQESSLPADLLGLDSPEHSSTDDAKTKAKPSRRSGDSGGKGGDQAASARSGKTSSTRHKRRSPTRSSSPSSRTSSSSSSSTESSSEDAEKVNAERIEELKRQVEAKKKLLQATREREKALTERWRAEKAQKQAEIHQLDAKLRSVWATVEDEKSTAESQLRGAQDEHEREMRLARQRIEQELKAEFDPLLTKLQAQLKEKQEEEAHLRSLLQSKGETEDLVNTAIAAALSSIVGRIQQGFAAEQQRQDNEWHDHVRELVRHEVRTSFAVSAESEAQIERDEMKKHFAGALEFWRGAEEEVKNRVLKLDDALMADVEATVREDLGRLQREQLSMEEVYVQSREAWALEHQRLLQAEFDASLRRREAELEEFRKLRHHLHVERLRDLEKSHEERMSAEEALHEAGMRQLREYYSREEQLQGERQRVALAAQQDVARSTETLQRVAGACEGVLASLKAYQAAVDESRTALEAERRTALQHHEGNLKALQDLVVKQASSVEDEHRALFEALSTLRVLQEQVEQQLEAEATWLAQQESACEGNRANWEREYRQWRALVQRERGAVEERFSTVLSALQESIAQLNAEERDVNAESVAMERAYTEMTLAVQKELDALREKETELLARQSAMDEAVAALEAKRLETTSLWQEMQREREQLATEREELRREEGKLEEMARGLELLRGQMDTAKAQTLAAAERGRLLKQQLALNMSLTAAASQRESCGALVVANTQQPALSPAAQVAPRAGAGPRGAKHRLAQNVLSELKRQLQGVNQLKTLPLGMPATTSYSFQQPHLSPNVAQLIYGGTDSSPPVSSHVPRWAPATEGDNVEELDPALRGTRGGGGGKQRRHADPLDSLQDDRPAVETRWGRGGQVPSTQSSSTLSSTAPRAHAASHTPHGHSDNSPHRGATPTEGGGYDDGDSPIVQPQRQRQESGDWSGVAGHTFTNLVGLSDLDSQY